MSKLYGTLTNEDSKTSTRCARSIITAAAQSYEGSVSVTLSYFADGPYVTIAVEKGSVNDPARRVLRCSLDELLNCYALEVVPA